MDRNAQWGEILSEFVGNLTGHLFCSLNKNNFLWIKRFQCNDWKIQISNADLGKSQIAEQTVLTNKNS